ncbi:phospholipase YtpA [Brevibacillus agri]|uniref:Alpha/beta hydrolase n=1 Tax=Brevibacillus agri TaxID=51101 RepID=A0A3M8AVU8_9BACL|nr:MULTISPECIES: alpha/beta hydrolase [Brevibacillus]ELK40925.1 lipase [Brevibacillus agri BAB-2500]EJL42341.1 lysophospholipase [Brevibacillus sp. CF112]MBG9565099.1 lipase [Brevibacillus agri]MBY0051091.1 lysophospholipase [Brevibacillus agri]MCG5250516.1 lysophospholipase [Brevibacillus agri]
MSVHKWSASEPKGAVVLVHGTGEHHGRYEHVAAFLNQQGWDVYAEDLPGWGRSPGIRGHVDSFDDYVQRVREWTVAALEDSAGKRPVFLLGHSLGGLIATRFVQREKAAHELAGLVLTSPCLQLKLEVPAWKAQAARLLDRFWPTLAIANGITPDMVSRDEAVQAAYKNDPLNYPKVSVRWFLELHKAMQAAWEERERLTVPVLVLQAGDDSLVDADAVGRFTEGIQGQKTFRRFPGLRHEVLNEPEREDVLSHMDRWMKEIAQNKM